MDSGGLLIQIDHALISTEALLKTCYWFSRDYACEVSRDSEEHSIVRLVPKTSDVLRSNVVEQQFIVCAMDFALREKVNARTAEIRDLLLAKAFSEAGVLEEQPQGTFGDALEEAKPDGIFKILSN